MNKCRSNVRIDGLTPSQERAIQAMLTARSIAAAARQADVGQSTLRRWLREDDNFQNKLRQFREQALSHAALLLQQGAARAVAIMYELIQSGRPIEPGRVTLIRTAIEFAFRAAIYCDIMDRVKTLEKAQRQPAAGNPRPAPAPAELQNGAARVSKRFPLVRDQPVWETSTSQSPQPRKRNFPRPARTCLNPTVKRSRNFSKSAHTCSFRTSGRPREAAPAQNEVFAPSRMPRPDSPWPLFGPPALAARGASPTTRKKGTATDFRPRTLLPRAANRAAQGSAVHGSALANQRFTACNSPPIIPCADFSSRCPDSPSIRKRRACRR